LALSGEKIPNRIRSSISNMDDLFIVNGTKSGKNHRLEEPEPTKGTSMKAKDLDKIFDDGEVNINDYLDLSKAFRPGQEQKRVNVDFPVWMIERLDREAGRLGVPRQSLIKVWIGEHLERDKSKKTKKKANNGGR
jgi:hypothetical protein